MNWGLVAWVAGALLTFAGIKFVWVIFTSLFSKESMEDMVDAIGDGIHNAGEKVTKSIKKSAQKRRARKKAEKRNDPPIAVRIR